MTLHGPLTPLTGHAEAIKSLSMLLDEHRLPHALLLHGPRGIGKRVLAEHLTWRLICGPADGEEAGADMFGDAVPVAAGHDGIAHDPASAQAAQLLAGSCPDAHVLAPDEGKKSIGVKAVREMLETLQRSADTARVCIIDCVDDLTEEAANMLLKTLEEPRHGIYFILLSHQLSRVLPTIRSRCRMLRITPLTLDEVKTVLQQQDADPDLAELAAGCPGIVLGSSGKKRLELNQKLAAWRQGEGVPAANTDGLLEALTLNVARKHAPDLADGMAYARLRELAFQQSEYNLPVALVQEAALHLVEPLKR